MAAKHPLTVAHRGTCASHLNGTGTWKAGCAERRTSGSTQQGRTFGAPGLTART
jgi:hypothetical protein